MPADFKLYLITDRTLCTARSLEEAVAEACRAGVRAVQLREKDLPARDLHSLAVSLREVTARYGCRLFVNDRADIALAVGADGVHCPESGLPVSVARGLCPNMSIGASTHCPEGARQAGSSGADFVLFGPVFPTPSKAAFGPPLGLEALADAARWAGVPVLAVGGIRPDNALACLDRGARGVGVISAILGARDIPGTVRAFAEALGGL